MRVYRPAADQRDATAQFNFVAKYWEGTEVIQNAVKAVHWFAGDGTIGFRAAFHEVYGKTMVQCCLVHSDG